MNPYHHSVQSCLQACVKARRKFWIRSPHSPALSSYFLTLQEHTLIRQHESKLLSMATWPTTSPAKPGPGFTAVQVVKCYHTPVFGTCMKNVDLTSQIQLHTMHIPHVRTRLTNCSRGAHNCAHFRNRQVKEHSLKHPKNTKGKN